MSEHHLWAGSVPASGRHDLVVVDGRSFAISAEAGDMVGATHGLVYDDIRHLSRLRMTVNAGRVELLSATTPTPLSAVTVSRSMVTVEDSRQVLPAAAGEPERHHVAELLVVRHRWLGGSLVEELSLRNPHSLPVSVHLELEVGADFAHVFDVKSGTGSGDTARPESSSPGRWTLRSPLDPEDSTDVVMEPAPDESDPTVGDYLLGANPGSRGFFPIDEVAITYTPG